MPTYDQIQTYLKANDLLFNKTVVMRLDRMEDAGLWIHCSPLLKDDLMDRVRDLLGDSCLITWMPSLEELHVKINQECLIHP